MKITRRQFIKGAAATGVALGLPLKFGVRSAFPFANSKQLTKWLTPIRNLTALGDPNGIPVLTGVNDPVFTNPQAKYYQVTVGEFLDQLHPELGQTRLWGYWQTSATPVQRHLGGVILAQRGTPVRIRFTNTLPSKHIIPVDTTIPGASQAENRIATHLHGGLVPWISDGGPFDWWTPGNGAGGYTGGTGASFLNGPGSVLDNLGQAMVSGQADYYYPNDQSFRLVWYHDHAHGITRINAYAGIASAYLILDTINDAYVTAGKIPPLGQTIPLVWQDKIFVDPATIILGDPGWATYARPDVQSSGSLWYAHTYDPKLYRWFKGKKTFTPPPVSVVPEFFGDTMLTNGTVYPLLEVEAKRYRFLMLNACNARFLNLNLLHAGLTPANPATPVEITTNPKTGFANLANNPIGPPIIQIGNEAGFLVTETTFPNGIPFNPATLTGNLLLGCAERADVIIDFTGQEGQEFILYNDAPGPFPVGPPTNDYYLGNPGNPIQPVAGTGPDTRNVLRIKVKATPPAVPDQQPGGAILNPLNIDPPLLQPAYTVAAGKINPLVAPAGAFLRPLTLNEDFDGWGRLRQLLGTTAPAPLGGFGLDYLAPATEVIQAGSTEAWQIYNLTADTHPIHFHLVNVQVLSRQPFRLNNGRFNLAGVARGPEWNELGWKETVQMHPGEVTTVAMKFDLPAKLLFTVPTSLRFPLAGLPVGATKANEYVWHCHILEHEEHDMMRPLVVYQKPLAVAPTSLNISRSTGGLATFTISNGLPPYTITPSAGAPPPNPITVNASGGTFTVSVTSGILFGTVYTYNITDSDNPAAAVLATITITA
jgi:spore coat protein A